jgi:hypothetical protein
VDRQSFIDALNAGYIDSHLLDLGKKSFRMEVHVLDRAALSVYDVTFHGVSHFNFDDQQVGEWERLQLTEIWIDNAPENSGSEEWEVSFSLWDLAHVKLRCMSITVDEEAIR